MFFADFDELLSNVAEAPRNAVVLIDGPSGAGKSTLADRLLSDWPGAGTPQLVRMDGIYPGWNGLEAANRAVVTELLAPRAAGLPAGWRRWDWVHGTPAEWNAVDPTRPLILEGCGTLNTTAAPFGDIRVWITADDVERKRRALARDSGGFDAHWDQWDADFSAYLAREKPIENADLLLDGDRSVGWPEQPRQ